MCLPAGVLDEYHFLVMSPFLRGIATGSLRGSCCSGVACSGVNLIHTGFRPATFSSLPPTYTPIIIINNKMSISVSSNIFFSTLITLWINRYTGDG